ncbi:MAG: zinc-ribbon domain containing protein [Selenomonadaceae bacterium]|nr:zinc-ribbon domain containing protein [Selenomonadaceae bacterium]
MEDSNASWNDDLETYVKDYKIFVDTCSLIYDMGDVFWIRLLELLEINGRLVFVPQSVINELGKYADSKTAKPETVERARLQQELLREMLRHDLMKVYGDGQTHADNELKTICTRYRVKYKILLITQDNDLAKDILKLNEDTSTIAHKIVAKRISPNGRLIDYGWQDTSMNFTRDGIEPFDICTKVTEIDNTPIKLTAEVQEGSKLTTRDRKPIELKKKLASGGEGIIYSTNTEYVAKIYKPEHLTIRRQKKLMMMLSRPIKYDGLCWPVTELYNNQSEFVGFLMPVAKGEQIQRSIFLPMIFKEDFPEWKRHDMVELCLTILRKIIFLHEHNVVIGDLNPANILVVSPKEVYFVDVDSYQIEDFPCPVGTINYTAPEIQQKNFGTFLRTMGNENFAVATLLFMLMLPGKTPYDQQGGEDPVTNIINMDFSYPFGEESNGRTPDGPWRFMWSHMTYKIKEAFYNTFKKGKRYALEDERLSSKDWYDLFNEYLRLLNNGKLIAQDAMSDDIFPTRFKYDPKSNYVKCMFCDELILESLNRKVCRQCGNKEIKTYKCKGCGKEMVFTYHEKYNRGLVRGYAYCQDCRTKVVYSAYCTQCGEHYEMTGGETDFFLTRGSELPRICQKCRQRNHELVKCLICKRDVELGDTDEIDDTGKYICNDCQSKVIDTYPCEECGETINQTVRDKYIYKRRYSHCKKCHDRMKHDREIRNQIGFVGVCQSCGESFELTNGEISFYRSRGLELPKRCPKCRGNSNAPTPKLNPKTTLASSIFKKFFSSIGK